MGRASVAAFPASERREIAWAHRNSSPWPNTKYVAEHPLRKDTLRASTAAKRNSPRKERDIRRKVGVRQEEQRKGKTYDQYWRTIFKKNTNTRIRLDIALEHFRCGVKMENAVRVNGSMVVTLISGQALDHYAKHVFEERKVVVANDKAGTIQQKERQKTAHTAVAIVKGWMPANQKWAMADFT